MEGGTPGEPSMNGSAQQQVLDDVPEWLGSSTLDSGAGSGSDGSWWSLEMLPDDEHDDSSSPEVASSTDSSHEGSSHMSLWNAAFGETKHASSLPLEEAANSIPLPVGLFDAAPGSAKRQRSQPNSKGVSHRGRTPKSEQLQAVPTSYAATEMSSLPAMRVEQLTYQGAFELIRAPNPCSGPRPTYLSQSYSSVADMRGLVFKETTRTRRKQRTDLWLAQGGPNGSSCETVAIGVTVRRKYGQLTLRHFETGEPTDALKFHEYTVRLESSQLDSTVPNGTTQSKMFHILPQEAQPPLVANDRSTDVQNAGTTEGNGKRISGLLTLQLATEAGAITGSRRQPRWIKFDDASGQEMGSIVPNESGDGVVISSAAGDFAEWHPKLPGERPFEEGDVVGFCPPRVQEITDADSVISERYYITLSTNGAKQLGIISRKAVVEGSKPKIAGESNSRCSWDTVAYCGRVPVKLIGPARAGDILVPSGREDGTAVTQTSKNAHIKIGVAEHDVLDVTPAGTRSDSRDGLYEMHSLSQKQFVPWKLVMCSVAAPSSTVSSAGQSWNQRRCRSLVAVLVMLIVIAAMIGIHWRTDSSCASIEPIVHGVLQGGCDGTFGSTCHVSCDVGFVAMETDAGDGRLYTKEEADAPLSVQALNPVGGSLSVTLPGNDSGPILQFPVCSSCFLTDGLMCQPGNRSDFPPFPLPMTPPLWVGHSREFDFEPPKDPYNCASDIRSLQTCQASMPLEEGGILCFAPFDGYQPCEICREIGPSQIVTNTDIKVAQRSIEVQGFSMTGYAAEGPGLACEATGRGLPWSDRIDATGARYDLDEHTLCRSIQHAIAAMPLLLLSSVSFDRCQYLSSKRLKTIFLDDIERTTRLCAPLQLQHHWREYWQDEMNQSVREQRRQLWLPQQQVDTEGKETETEKMIEGEAAQGVDATLGRVLQGKGSKERSPALSRHCKGSGEYTGSAIRCVRYSHCPAEKVGALRNNACKFCAGKEAVLLVPRTPIPLLNSHSATSASAVVVHVPCPAGFYGYVNRTCSRDGWVDEAPLQGECTRKRCPALGVRLAPLDTSTTTHNTTVVLPTAVEGTGRVYASCPKGFAGNVSAVCIPDADRWNDLQVHCTCTACEQLH